MHVRNLRIAPTRPLNRRTLLQSGASPRHAYVCSRSRKPATGRLAFQTPMSVEILRPAGTKAEVVGPVVALFVAASAMAAGVRLGYLAWSLDSFPHGAAAVLLLLVAPAL